MEREMLLRFLRDITERFERRNAFALRELGNKAIERAALANDRLLAGIALIAYCLSKLQSKQHIARHGKWVKLRKRILQNLNMAAGAIEKGDAKGFERSLQRVVGSVQSTDRQLGNYVQGLYEKARVKYASTAYALGLSLSKAAALTGANKKDLLRYIGATRVHDREAITIGIGERLGRLRRQLRAEKK